MSTELLTPEPRAQYDENGFVRLPGFADPDVCDRSSAPGCPTTGTKGRR